MGDIIIKKNINGNISPLSNISGTISYGNGTGGTTDYNVLINKPQIESIELIGNKSFEDLGLDAIDPIEILDILT